MKRPPAEEFGKGAGSLRPIDELLKKPHDSNLYPNLIEDYYNLADKDIHLAELYRLAATSQDDRFIPNPVQAVNIDGEIWVDVLAEIKDKTDLKQVREIMQVHTYTRRFVSGRVLVQRLPELNKHTERMQTARPIHLTLDDSVPDIRADQETLFQLFNDLGNIPQPTGKNVIIGIVDADCDFLHPVFYDEAGNTRILYLWDQNGTPKTAEVPYGREYNQNFINQAIQKKLTYEDDLEYQPAIKAHGTHVMDIAAGKPLIIQNNDEEPKISIYPGVAPDADLIFVHLGLPAPTETDEEFLGSSKRLSEAVQYIFDKADELNKPAVVNLSLATDGGPHDGTSIVENLFDDLLNQQAGRAIVIAAGNNRAKGVHTMDFVKSNEPREIKWKIPDQPETDHPQNRGQRFEMEIWYEGQTPLTIDVFDPNNTFLGSCNLGETLTVSENDFPEPTILIHHAFDISANENHIDIFIDHRYPNLKTGEYRFNLKISSETTPDEITYHAWIERNDKHPSNFPSNHVKEYTINSIGTGRLPITVGAYDPDGIEKTDWFGSGSGPSRNPTARDKPTISAPGDKISAAQLHQLPEGDRPKSRSGTSQAAPHVAGVIALMYQTARDLRNPPKVLSSSEIRQILIDTADRSPPQGNNGSHDNLYGYGRVNCERALKNIMK